MTAPVWNGWKSTQESVSPSLSLPGVAPIKGHIATPTLPSPLRYVPSFSSREDCRFYSLADSRRMALPHRAAINMRSQEFVDPYLDIFPFFQNIFKTSSSGSWTQGPWLVIAVEEHQYRRPPGRPADCVHQKKTIPVPNNINRYTQSSTWMLCPTTSICTPRVIDNMYARRRVAHGEIALGTRRETVRRRRR